jgi:hypothetical protein
MLGATGANVVTMSSASALLNCRLSAVGATNTSFINGVVFPATSTVDCRMQNVRVSIDGSAVPAAGTANLNGVLVVATGGAPTRNFQNMDSCNVSVVGNGNGNKRGLLVSTGIGNFNVTNSWMAADPTTVSPGATTAASYGGVEITATGASANLMGSYARGTTGAVANATGWDISQTIGTLGIDGGCSLAQGNANQLNFTSLPGASTTTYTIALAGTVAARTTFMPLWGPLAALPAATVTEASMQLTVPRTTIFKNARARSQTAGGGGATLTFNLRRNGNNTLLALPLGNTTSVTNLTNSVTFFAGDQVSVQCISSAAAGTNISVQYEAV